jgi:hypothetical protein
MTRIIKTSALLLGGIMIAASACKKESEDFDLGAAANDTYTTSVTSTIDQSADKASFKHHLSNPEAWLNNLPECATATERMPEGGEYPKIITIDFGTTNCTTLQGKTVRGMIVVELSNAYNVQGASRTVTFTDFYVNDRSVEGKRSSLNLGENTNGNWVYSYDSEMTFSCRDGQTMTKTSTGTREWLTGFDTETAADDAFYKTGTSTGESMRGTHTRTIVEPLLIQSSCDYITQGVVEMECKRGTTSINFGDGTCDNLATVTRGDKIMVVDLDEFKQRRQSRNQ